VYGQLLLLLKPLLDEWLVTAAPVAGHTVQEGLEEGIGGRVAGMSDEV
jgi:hypothetical protein